MKSRAKVLIAALALAFCGTVDAANAAEKVTFDFWFGLTGDLAKVVDQVCKRFNDSQDQYEVVCTSQGSYDQTLQNAIAAYRVHKNPTVVQIFDAGTLDLLLSGAFYPARKLMAENGYTVNWDDYFPGIANYYANSKGELNSFPFNSSTALLYYNKDAFAKVGVNDAPKTWEEIADAGKAMLKAGYGCALGWDFDPWATMEQFSAIHNQPIATKGNGYQGLDAELVVNKTKFVDMVKLLKQGYDEGWVKLKRGNTGPEDMTGAFASGECQMMLQSVANHGTVGKLAAPGVNWAVTMLPVFAGTERHNSLVGGASLWALAGKSPEEYKAAAAFFNFIAKPESALFWSTNTGYIPVTNSGYEFMKSSGFYDKAPYKGREIAIASLTASPITENTRGIRLGSYVQIRKELRDAFADIMAGKVSVQQGLDDFVARGNAILRKFEKTYAGQPLP